MSVTNDRKSQGSFNTTKNLDVTSQPMMANPFPNPLNLLSQDREKRTREGRVVHKSEAQLLLKVASLSAANFPARRPRDGLSVRTQESFLLQGSAMIMTRHPSRVYDSSD